MAAKSKTPVRGSLFTEAREVKILIFHRRGAKNAEEVIGRNKIKWRYKMYESLDQLTSIIIGCAIDVHRVLGPGLLEAAYEACLVYELRQKNIKLEQQKHLPVVYKGNLLDCGYRLDLLIEEQVIIELKAIEKIEDIHKAQLLSYLKLSGCKIGLLINFNVELLKDGICRMVNGL